MTIESRPDACEQAGRRPGRPRSLRAERAILEAASALLVERGFQGMSVEEVAERAGVGKATIYRRWPSKAALVHSAVCGIPDDVVLPDTGSFRGDVLAILAARHARAESHAWPMVARIVAEAIGNPDVMSAYRDAVVRPRRALGAEVIRRAKARGEIRADADEDVLLDALVGFVIYRVFVSPDHAMPAPEVVDRFLDVLLQGVAETPARA
ncbi:MAG TPA: TetR/AcrR family transcriptional regulator [Thermomicrobiaceae bacterium]|nr:TetR/AcrR family transcriptional regulator [Thermomicrobiaceae bacterium]